MATDSIFTSKDPGRQSSSPSEERAQRAAPSPDPGHDRGFVKSLERGLAVIRVLSSPGPGLASADVARAAGLTRAATRRFLLTLERLGYVRSDGRLFALTPRVLELGYAFLSSLTLPEIAQPHLQTLVERVQESSSVSVLDGEDIVYVARAATRRIMTVAISVGTRFPAYATSMGRVLLASLEERELDAFFEQVELKALTGGTLTRESALRSELDRVRRQGWALVDQELEEGLRSVAAPIHDGAGLTIAAVNVSAHASRTTLEEVRRRLLPQLLETTARIDADLAAGQL
jgi:IclR family pca regulon transcriptional regulator